MMDKGVPNSKPLWKGDMAVCPKCGWREFYPNIIAMVCKSCMTQMPIQRVVVYPDRFAFATFTMEEIRAAWDKAEKIKGPSTPQEWEATLESDLYAIWQKREGEA